MFWVTVRGGVKETWTWHFGIWFNGGVMSMVGLNGLTGLFQPIEA